MYLLFYLSFFCNSLKLFFTDTKEVRIVCYYTNWSVYRPGDAKFNPQNINPYLCTHLVYAFGGFTKENTLKPFDKYQDVEKGEYTFSSQFLFFMKDGFIFVMYVIKTLLAHSRGFISRL